MHTCNDEYSFTADLEHNLAAINMYIHHYGNFDSLLKLAHFESGMASSESCELWNFLRFTSNVTSFSSANHVCWCSEESIMKVYNCFNLQNCQICPNWSMLTSQILTLHQCIYHSCAASENDGKCSLVMQTSAS